MECWISWNNKAESHQLPVLPSVIEIESSNSNTTVNIMEEGVINLIGKPDLRQMTLESFFPSQQYPFVTTQRLHHPYKYVNSIEKWRRSGLPIRVIVTDTTINTAFAIESFTYGERDGSRDVYFVLELAEYVFPGVEQEMIGGFVPPPYPHNPHGASVRSVQSIASTYTVRPNDTLTEIALRTTGASANYRKIQADNNIGNPNQLKVGTVLKL